MDVNRKYMEIVKIDDKNYIILVHISSVKIDDVINGLKKHVGLNISVVRAW